MISKAHAFLLGMLLADASAAIAVDTGGFPSRPQLQSLGVNTTAPASPGKASAKAISGNSAYWQALSADSAGNIYLCTSSTSNVCSTSISADDTLLGGSNTFHISDTSNHDYFLLSGGNTIAVGGGVTTFPWTTCTSSTFSSTPSGFSSVSAQTIKYAVCGKMVTVIVPAFTGTSNAATFGMGGLPAAIQPASVVSTYCGQFEDNGTTFLQAQVSLATSPAWEFDISKVSGTNILANSNGWTSSGTKGLNSPCTFTYSIQ